MLLTVCDFFDWSNFFWKFCFEHIRYGDWKVVAIVFFLMESLSSWFRFNFRYTFLITCTASDFTNDDSKLLINKFFLCNCCWILCIYDIYSSFFATRIWCRQQTSLTVKYILIWTNVDNDNVKLYSVQCTTVPFLSQRRKFCCFLVLWLNASLCSKWNFLTYVKFLFSYATHNLNFTYQKLSCTTIKFIKSV